MKQKSKYSASAFDEVKRLELQSKATQKLDDKVINYVIKQGKFKGKNFAVLDVGCGYGNVAKSRFAKFENAKVLGIDINKEVIAQNNLNNQNPNFSYAAFDVENENFADDFSLYLKQNNLPKFDIIFLSYVLQHLKNPDIALQKLKHFMNEGGFIIVRGSDDGSKMAYHDKNLVAKIIKLYNSAEGISDRLNGRKIYSQLYDAGFENIKMFFEVKETATLTPAQKQVVFEQSFSYRKNIFKTLASENPKVEIHKQNLAKMERYLSALEQQFQNPKFWYSELQMVGIAQKEGGK